MAAAVAALIAGCGGQRTDPIASITRSDLSAQRRIDAARSVDPDSPDGQSSAYRDALARVAFANDQPVELSRFAVARLIEIDPAEFARAARRRLARVDRWPVLEQVADAAIEAQLVEVAPAAVSSLARPTRRVPDADRPEARLLGGLFPDEPVEGVLLDLVAAARFDPTPAEQVAAWAVLVRNVDPSTLHAALAAAPGEGPLIAALKAATERLDVLPHNRYTAAWATLTTIPPTAHLAADQRAGLELRHLSVLPARDDHAAASRDDLLDAVASRLADAAHHPRDAAGVLMQPPPERVADHAQRLTWGDLRVIARLLALPDDPAVVAELFRQADADHLDRDAEHGGALVLAPDGSIRPVDYPPFIRKHDRIYLPPPELITRLYQPDALAHYHFHAQEHDSAAYAGPGAGDFQFIDRYRFNGVVLSFIDRDTLNVDFYRHGGVVIDLGVIRRHGGRTRL